MAYANGRVPENLLVKEGEHLFFPGTYRRWCALRERVKRERGVTLYISPGDNAYRDYQAQVDLRQYYTNLGMPTRASKAGYSSHGGLWSGYTTQRHGLPYYIVERESGAIDVYNYDAVPWSYFVQVAESVGFIADAVIPHEGWHLVDLDPWGHNLPAQSGENDTEDDVKITDLYKEFRVAGGQKVSTSGLIYINAKKEVSVAAGPSLAVTGNLSIELDIPEGAVVQIAPIVSNFKDGKEVSSLSLRAQEVVGTSGKTYAKVPVNCALQAGQRLRFRIAGKSVVLSAVFRGSSFA